MHTTNTISILFYVIVINSERPISKNDLLILKNIFNKIWI